MMMTSRLASGLALPLLLLAPGAHAQTCSSYMEINAAVTAVNNACGGGVQSSGECRCPQRSLFVKSSTRAAPQHVCSH
jgi:hypothetical protein